MTREEYYITPPDAIFNDIKNSAIFLWKQLDYDYESNEAVERIEKIQNIKDNAWTIVAMFDHGNMFKLLNIEKPETKEKLEEVLRFGGII